jgi:pimeloyl-ACP methyl ester carboxylesterase
MIVLLPGMDGTAAPRSDFVAALAPEVVVKTITYPTDQPLGYSQLEFLVRAEIPDCPFILIGESFSGPIAISIAASNPPNLRGLVFVGSFARSPIQVPDLLHGLTSLAPLWLAPSSLICSLLLGPEASLAQRKCVREAITTVKQRVWQARLRAILSADALISAGKIAAPTLYMRATHDCIVSRRMSEQLTQAIPHAQLTELDGPHFLLLARAVEVAQRIKSFMREMCFEI